MTGTTESRGNRLAFSGRIRLRRAVVPGLGALVASLAASALVLGGADGSPAEPPAEGPGSVGPVGTQRADLPCPFGAVESLGPGVNTPFFEGSPTVSADERTLFFTSERSEGRQDLFVSTRPHPTDPWGAAEGLGLPVNHPEAHDYALRLSLDGKALFFSSERPGGFGSSDLWVTRRESVEAPWGPPENLGPGVNTEAFEAFPTPSADGRTLYFSRSTAWDSPDSHLWVATRDSEAGLWGAPERLPEPAQGPGADFAPAISSDGLTLYFASDRPGNIGRVDLWFVRRESAEAPWGPPENLGAEVNVPSSVTMAPFPSVDGARLYFMSNRPGGFGGPDCGFWDCFDLYVATRTCGGEGEERG